MCVLKIFLFVVSAAGFKQIDGTHIEKNGIPNSTLGDSQYPIKGNNGETRETCHMQCRWDGTCTETVQTWTWNCNGVPQSKISKTFFKVFSYLLQRIATAGK